MLTFWCVVRLQIGDKVLKTFWSYFVYLGQVFIGWQRDPGVRHSNHEERLLQRCAHSAKGHVHGRPHVVPAHPEEGEDNIYIDITVRIPFDTKRIGMQ